jgi:hypothetical protein
MVHISWNPKSECDQVLTVGNCNRQSDGFSMTEVGQARVFAVVAENAFMP